MDSSSESGESESDESESESESVIPTRSQTRRTRLRAGTRRTRTSAESAAVGDADSESLTRPARLWPVSEVLLVVLTGTGSTAATGSVSILTTLKLLLTKMVQDNTRLAVATSGGAGTVGTAWVVTASSTASCLERQQMVQRW